MSIGQEYLEDWIGYWSYTGQRTLDAWYQLTQKARDPELRPQSLLAHVFDYWMDVAAASWAVCQGPQKRPALIVFTLYPGDDCPNPKSIVVMRARVPNRKAEIVWLGRTGPENAVGMEFHEQDLHADYEEGTLKVSLTTPKAQLQGKGPRSDENEPLAEGIYRAIVHVAEIPLAEVLVVVRAAAPLAGSAASKKKSKG